MEKTETIGRGVYYTLEDKHFWAVFYNEALHNSFLTLTHIYSKLGLKEYDTEEHAIQVLNRHENFTKNANAIDKSRFLNLIHYHFPFLEVMNLAALEKGNTNYDKEKNIEILDSILKQLENYRNYFSHHYYRGQINLQIDRKWINGLFDTNVRKIKEDFFGVRANDFVEKDPFEDYVVHLRQMMPNKDNRLKDPNGKTLRAVKNNEFRTPLLKKENNLLFLTEFGHVLFVSLFLEKSSAIRLQKNIRGLKDSRETKFRMTNEAFCRTRILTPKIKLKSDNNEDAFLMDMSSELAKAPRELYDHLLSEDKNLFRTLNIGEESDDEVSLIMGSGYRSDDRFPYFALRFFDENEIFEKLRFQIDLGTYHFHIYESMINRVKETRHLTRQLYGFSRLQNFATEHSPPEWKAKEKDLDYFEESKEPFIRKTYPHYHIDAGKIGIRFPGNLVRWPHLELDVPDTQYPKYRKMPLEVSEAFLSVNELPFMVFCHLIYASSGEPKKVENLIKGKYEGLKKLFEEIKNGTNSLGNDQLESWLNKRYGLTKRDIPERLYQFLSGQQKDRNLNSNYHDRFNKLIQETDQLIKRFIEQKKTQIKIGKKSYRRFESGKFADWLAKDFMLFQPQGKHSDGTDNLRSKPNPKKYQLVQKSIALYDVEKNNLLGLFRDCNLVDSSNEHPFLQMVMRKNHFGWMDFYLDYLRERKKYLYETFKLAQKTENYEPYRYFLRVKLRNTAFENIAKESWLKQLLLPTGIFMPEILSWFKVNYPTELTQLSVKNDNIPFAKLVELYLQLKHKDVSQPFYNELSLLYSHFAKSNPNGLSFQQRDELLPGWKAEYKALKEQLPQIIEMESKCEKLAESAKSNKLKSLTTIKNHFIQDFHNEVTNIFFDTSRFSANQIIEKVKNKVLEPYKFKMEKCRNYRRFLDNEQKIRNYRTRDQITSMMIRDMLAKRLGASTDDGFNLRDIQPIGESGISNYLNDVQRLTQRLTIYQSDEKGQLIKVNGNKVELGTWAIYSTDIKRKNRGTFLHFVKDRRLNNLALYIQKSESDTPEINRKRVEFELDLYSRERMQIIRLAHGLEALIVQINPELISSDRTYMKFRDLIENLPDYIPSILKKQIIALRNAVLHNQYPLPELFEGEIKFFNSEDDLPKKDGLGIISQFSELADRKFKEIEQLVNNIVLKT